MKRKRMMALVLAGIMGVCTLTACQSSDGSSAESGSAESSSAESAGGDSETKTLGVAYCTLAEEFAVDLQKGIQDKAAELGFEISEVDYALDLAKGNDEIDNFINMDVDGMILWPLDATAFAGASDKLAEAGIPIVTVDSTIEENVSCFVTSDNKTGGVVSAEYAMEQLGDEGTVLVVTPGPGMTSQIDRCEGFFEVLEQYPNVKVIEQMDAGTQARAGYAQTVENALNANPEIEMIFANCGDCALGALSVVEMYPEKYGDVKIVGYDATEEQIEAMKEGRQIICSYAQDPYGIGATAIEQMQKILNGEEVESDIRTEGGLVTHDNVDEY